MSVLDALIWVRGNLDSSLAIRYSCTNANTCKECMVKVEGKTVYACTERLGTKPVTVGPHRHRFRSKTLRAGIYCLTFHFHHAFLAGVGISAAVADCERRIEVASNPD